jgi:uncharacterized protein YifN (PemK superfamily)
MFELCWDTEKERAVGKPGIVANVRPEIGKMRPVVVVRAHKRNSIALVVPLTTQKPTKEVEATLRIPAGIMPGILGRNECWALCDMVQAVSLKRLQNPYGGRRNMHLNPQETKLPQIYFDSMMKKLQDLFKI